MKANRFSRGDALKIGITMLAIISLAASMGAATEINSCTTISSPGEYVLNASIVDSKASNCINITSSNVTLDGAGYTIDGIKATNTYGVFVYDPANNGLTNINIKNLKLTDWYYGIYYNGYFNIKNGIINNNTISSDYSGITLYYVSNSTVTDNNVYPGGIDITYSNNINVSNNNAGISLGHSGGNIITKNDASSKGGISLFYAGDNIITDNDVSSNHYGFTLYYADRNTFSNNRATGSSTGLFLNPMSTNNIIADNDISSNDYGIYSYYASNNTITNNTVNSNNYGIYLTSSGNNTIYNNYFNNKNNAWDDGNNTWSITKVARTNIIGGSWTGGNYWSDYTGQDLNSDGLGETLIPYNSFGNITNGGDYLPLVQVSTALGITGTIFNDLNDNRKMDAGEEGLANWKVRLKGFDSLTRTAIKKTATTDANGNYIFTDMKPGFYVVSEMMQPGWVPTIFPARSVHFDQNAVIDFGNKKTR